MSTELISYPVVYLEQLTIKEDYSEISGLAKIYAVTYDSEFNPILHSLKKEAPFSIKNTYSKNFHELLKLHSENLIVEFFISEGKTNFVYDYQTRMIEAKQDNDSTAIGNTGGYYYSTNKEKAEELKDGN